MNDTVLHATCDGGDAAPIGDAGEDSLNTSAHADSATSNEPRLEIDEDRVLEAIVTAKRVAGDFGLEVQLGEPGEGSFCTLKFGPRRIVLDPVHISRSPQMAVFVPAHEGAHAAISIGPAALAISPKVAAELYGQLGFGFMHNCQEDGSVNTWAQRRYPGLGPSIATVYDEQVGGENPELSTPEVDQITQLLGVYPRFAQFGSEILKRWHTGQWSTDLDPQVANALDHTWPIIERAINLLPQPNFDDREEVLKTARARWTLMTEHVWPEFKKLVELDVNEQTLREALNQLFKMMELQAGMGQAGAQSAPGGGTISLAPGNSGSRNSSPILLPFSPEQMAKLQEAMNRSIRQQAERMQAQMEANGETVPSLGDLESYIRQQMDKGSGIPIQELPSSLRGAAKEYFESLSEDEQAELHQNAEDQLKRLEDELNRELESKFNNDKAPHHSEIRDAAERSAQHLEDESRQRIEEQEIIEKLRAGRSVGLTDYERTLAPLKSEIEIAYGRLAQVLVANAAPMSEPGYSSGTRIRMSQFMQAQADPAIFDRMWERRVTPTERSYGFKVIVDVSGSMYERDGGGRNASKIEEAQKAALYLSELLERLTTLFSLDAFSDTILELKKVDEPLAASGVRENLAALTSMGGGGTMDALAIAKAYRELKELAVDHKYIVIITDAGSSQGGDLGPLTERIRNEGEVVLIQFGIGEGTRDAAGFYQFSYGDLVTGGGSPDKNFFKVFCKVMESTILTPELFAPTRGADFRRVGLAVQRILFRSFRGGVSP